MKIKDKYAFCEAWFSRNIPAPETELSYGNTYELLVAVILSAQCTDKRVNMTTPALFEKYPDAPSLAAAAREEVFEIIKSISYPNNKAGHLVGMARMLMEEFKGEVPATREELMRLPGVGRKTANVITAIVFNQPHIAVDTHVFRVSQRIGLVKPSKTPLEVELQLQKHVRPENANRWHHWLILHGRYTCLARRPLCEQCGLREVCTYYKRTAARIRIEG